MMIDENTKTTLTKEISMSFRNKLNYRNCNNSAVGMKFILGGLAGGVGRGVGWGGWLGGLAAHCIPSHSVHCYKGNILQFDNYWGAPDPPSPPVPTGPNNEKSASGSFFTSTSSPKCE